MWNQCPIEVLKLLASIATPVIIAIFGLRINQTIQRQNTIAQRQSSWLTKWADDFLKTASGFNDSATDLMLLYVVKGWEAMDYSTEGKDPGKLKLSLDDYRALSIKLNRGWLELSKFVAFAKVNGMGLEKAATALLSEAASWCNNGGGDLEGVRVFRQKQLDFNINVQKVHAELLGLNDSK
jgi:hypothetical protein